MASKYLLSGLATSRRLALERFEPRVMLAADLAPPSGEADGIATLSSPGDFHLPGSIAGSVSAIDERALGAPASGLSGVQVELLDVSGDVLAEAITDELGRYEFPAIEPGVYAIRQQQPVGFDEGFAAFGSGGGRVRDANLIIDIVVHAGEMLDGYNFVEPMPAISATSTPRSEVKAFPFAPPLTVEWTRPAAREEAFSQPTPPPKLIALPPVQMRAAEPFIGASSRLLDEVFVSDESEWSQLAADSRQDEAELPKTGEGQIDGELIDRIRTNEIARDRIFDMELESPNGEVAGVPVANAEGSGRSNTPAPNVHIAAKPAA